MHIKSKIINHIFYILLSVFATMITFLDNSASAATLNYSVDIMPTLSLNLSSANISLKLNPVSKTFDSTNLDVSVATNNLNGYKLYLNTIEDTTSLTRQNDGTSADSLNATIETLPSSGEGSCANGCAESTFPTNYWGYRISGTTGSSGSTDSGISDFTNTKYFPFTPSAIISSSEGTTNEITSTLSFASKIDYNRPSGVYNLNLNFQALPKMSNYYMQDFYNNPELAEQLCTEDPTMVMDKRDGHTYAIARLKDGKCWMVQNLRLGENLEPVTGSLILTDEDTNISTTDIYNPRSEFVLTNQVVDGKMPMDHDGWDGPAFYCTNDYGCYYNFYTATAGIKSEGDGAIATRVDVTSTICPKGWTLPATLDNTKMARAYGMDVDNATIVASRLLVSPTTLTKNINGDFRPGFMLGGFFYNNGSSDLNMQSNSWSRTTGSTAVGAQILAIRELSVNPANGALRYYGISIRCLINE